MTEDLPLFKGQIRHPKQYSLREDLAVFLSVQADFFHSLLDQIESFQTEPSRVKDSVKDFENLDAKIGLLQTELSEVKYSVKDFENLHAENETLRDKHSRWLHEPDDCSGDCCSIADSLEHDYSDKRHNS